jgi:hypothetical protein
MGGNSSLGGLLAAVKTGDEGTRESRLNDSTSATAFSNAATLKADDSTEAETKLA